MWNINVTNKSNIMGSIKAKFGECVECENGKDVLLYRVSPKECRYHYNKNKEDKYYQNVKEKPKKKVKKIAMFSAKKLEGLKKYRKARDIYLSENSGCEVIGCGNRTTNLHHKAGRSGSLLYDKEYFMACCSVCHPERIHNNPKWSRENGYMIRVDLK